MHKTQKGITLVALIITIIVLIILAVVAINSVSDGGIIRHAQNARTEYIEKADEENTTLQNYTDIIEANKPNGGETSTGGTGNPDTTPATTIEEAQQISMLTKTVNSDITDKYNNKITVPAGFKILVDNTTVYTANDINVTKGIVITDGTNEFVWVPVGDAISDGTNTYKITLGRYGESNFTKNANGEYVPATTDPSVDIVDDLYSYDEELKDEQTDKAHAKDIATFKTSAESKGGYYIGRFEAGVSGYDETATNNNTQTSGDTNWTKYKTADGKEPQLVCKTGQQVWNYVTQKKASDLCRNMYTNKPFESDLINSYAWDTAIIFIQTFGGCEDYYNRNYSTSFADTGVNSDKYCNIHDMSGNAMEWSTETHGSPGYTCVIRGGARSTSTGNAYYCAGTRFYGPIEYCDGDFSFRPVLYM